MRQQTVTAQIVPYTAQYRLAIRTILERIGWAEQYIVAMIQNADLFSQDAETYSVYVATSQNQPVGFIYVQYYAWNQLSQIQGLAVDPAFQRQGIALALVKRVETFAREKHSRGIYVDTPVQNTGGCRFYEAAGYQPGYIMPRYYEDQLDGVTYQKFFDSTVTIADN